MIDYDLNCSQTITSYKKTEDGYLYAKPTLKTQEEWILLDSDDWIEIRDKNNALLYKYKSYIEEFSYIIEEDGIKKTIQLTEKRLVTYHPMLETDNKYAISKQAIKSKISDDAKHTLLDTSETNMSDQEIYDTYQNLREIKASF